MIDQSIIDWFVPGVGVELKHGDHDQSTHGHGGGDSQYTSGGYFNSDKTYKKEIIEGKPATYGGHKTIAFSRAVGHADGNEIDAKIVARQTNKGDNSEWGLYASASSFVGSNSVLIGKASSPKEAREKSRELLSRLVDADHSGAVYEDKSGKYQMINYSTGKISEVQEKL